MCKTNNKYVQKYDLEVSMAKRLPDGEHREYYEDRSLKAVYTIKDGKKEGTYTEYAQNSDRVILTEEYQGGELHGERIEYNYSGNPSQKETYEHGTITERRKFDSYSKDYEYCETYRDGELYHLRDKRWSADIDMYYKDGEEYNGTHYHTIRVGGKDGDDYATMYTLKDGKYHGRYYDEQEGIDVNYDTGVLHGKYSVRLEDGSTKKGEYNNGQFTGTITSKDGLTVESWVDGKLDCTTNYEAVRDWSGIVTGKGKVVSVIRTNGECSEYRNGVLVKRYEQKDGVKDGKYEEFDPKGWLKESSLYHDGKLKQKTEYYSDGNVVTGVKDNTSDGEHREYYEDRSLKAVYTIKDGKKEGTYTEYAQNSDRVILTEEYQGGELHGERIEYNYSGNPSQKETYEHGTITERRKFDSYSKDYEYCETYRDGELYHLRDKRWSADIDMYYKDGEEYNGTHYHTIRVGGKDGDDYATMYTLKDGKYHGRYYDEQEGIDVNYDTGVLHGKYSVRLEDGSTKKGEYNNGQFTGTITSKDGLKVEHIGENNTQFTGTITSKDGLKVEHIGENNTQFTGTITSKDGLTVESWVDGKLELTTTYESAKINHWSGKVESHGRVTSEVRPNGECSEYRNGILVKKYEQKDGVKDGKYEEFDPNGWTRAEGQYKDGKLNGFYKEYNSDGTVASRRFYKDGKDMTPQREVMRKAAEEYVSSTEGVAPRRTKLQKAGVAIKMAIAGMKEGKS